MTLKVLHGIGSWADTKSTLTTAPVRDPDGEDVGLRAEPTRLTGLTLNSIIQCACSGCSKVYSFEITQGQTRECDP